MKSIFLGVVLLIGMTVGIIAQEFHPYKVKSGKITFEKRKYAMHAVLHRDSNGNISGSRSNPSYAEEEVVYYWDNYGDIAYEVSYQVSEFGGKPLPKKVKKYERLWKGEHHYYYDVMKNKVSDDPYYTRKACLKAGKLYEVSGCLAVMYPKSRLLNKESVGGKMTNHYKESESWDFYTWNGIILRDVNYSTKKKNGECKRFETDREKIAVKIDTDIEIDRTLFTPEWLKNR